MLTLLHCAIAAVQVAAQHTARPDLHPVVAEVSRWFKWIGDTAECQHWLWACCAVSGTVADEQLCCCRPATDPLCVPALRTTGVSCIAGCRCSSV